MFFSPLHINVNCNYIVEYELRAIDPCVFLYILLSSAILRVIFSIKIPSSQIYLILCQVDKKQPTQVFLTWKNIEQVE